MFLGLTLI